MSSVMNDVIAEHLPHLFPGDSRDSKAQQSDRVICL